MKIQAMRRVRAHQILIAHLKLPTRVIPALILARPARITKIVRSQPIVAQTKCANSVRYATWVRSRPMTIAITTTSANHLVVRIIPVLISSSVCRSVKSMWTATPLAVPLASAPAPRSA